MLKLGENNIKTLDDLGDLASDELLGMVGENVLTEENANAIIMGARAHWFEDAELGESKDEKTVAEENGNSAAEYSVENKF